MPGVNQDQQNKLGNLENREKDAVEPQEERELTQTDRINRHLLIAFLQSLNQVDSNGVEASSNDSDNDSHWSEDEGPNNHVESIADEVTALSDIDDEQNNILETAQDLQETEENTEEVQRDETEENGDQEADGERKVVKAKRIVKNPQPRLNAETLKGSRGIASLPSYFERIKFKGKGHEEQDLNAIIKTYEYWCHRLFPKFPFEACIDRLEKLGNKKAVQTHIKRIRFDLLLEEEEKPIIDSSDDETNMDGFVHIDSDQISKQNKQFEQLLQAAPSVNQPPLQLTEEQQERIRLNKEKAEKLRQERLRKIRAKAEENLQISSQITPGPSGLNSELDFSQTDELQTYESEPEFDLESSVKGKSVMRKGTVKKPSTKGVNAERHHNEPDNAVFDGNVDESISHKGSRNMGSHTDGSVSASNLGIDEDTIRDLTPSTILSSKERRRRNVIESDDSDQETVKSQVEGNVREKESFEERSNDIDKAVGKTRRKVAIITDSDQSDEDIDMVSSHLRNKNILSESETKQSSTSTIEPMEIIENHSLSTKSVSFIGDPNNKENSLVDNTL